MTPRDRAALRLAAARACAWALLFGGWLVLGALGQSASRGTVAAAGPLGVWLLAIGVLLVATARWTAPPRGLALGLVLAAAGTLAALAWSRAPWAPWLAALAWAPLPVLASRTVQALRRDLGRPARAPLWPAACGAAAAWLAAGDPLALDARAACALVIAAALGLVLLRPPAGAPAGGCRAGLFDCSLPMPTAAAWRTPADAPLHAAALVMLPMMAALPALAEWCATGGWTPRAVSALHLAAMFVPALLLAPRLGAWSRARLRAVVALLLVAGAAAVLAADGAVAFAGMLLHGAAWSLAWAAPMLARDRARPPTDRLAPLRAAGVAAGGVLALAAVLAAAGPPALREVHVLIAIAAVAGAALARWRRR
jgi:hypothetical protein